VVPWDQVKSVYDVATGQATTAELGRLLGRPFGMTYSQGYPGGQRAYEDFRLKQRYDAARTAAFHQAYLDMRAGNRSGAYKAISPYVKAKDRAYTLNQMKAGLLSDVRRQKLQRAVGPEKMGQ
jgi:hypothetical protein